MSDTFLVLIPTKPDFIPPESAQATALERLKSFVPKAEDVCSDSTSDIRFFDAGLNFKKVSCPLCRLGLPMGWWEQSMETAGRKEFSDLRINLPCCGKASTLNDLMYFWAQGFARFAFEVQNPGLKDLRADQIRELETIVGCSLRMILSQY